MTYKLVPYKELNPTIGKGVYLADNVIIAGDVKIAENASIWFNSVVRGDVAPVTIGQNTNIQDGTIIHTSRFDGPTNIGSNITIGHLALIHACTIEDNAFIGMSSTIMDKAIIEEYGFVAAGSLVTPGKIIKKKELWAGRPAKFIRNITDEELEFMKDNVRNYLELANNYK
ncbi:MAG: gamma carbonic anhydrase family protein [Rickettsiaceae bacterium]|nr:gamma carbonic anhydrase family protein [Rickettsiaceae bacterium]